MPEIAQTADHALRILEELGKGEALTATELGTRLELKRTVVHRLLSTLAARSFVMRRGDVYRPGVALIQLAATIEPDLRSVATPILATLAEEHGETTVLDVVDGQDAVVLAQSVPNRHLVRVSQRVGARSSLTVGAGGRAILAFLPPHIIARLRTAAGQPRSLESTLGDVRRQRYAVSHDELQQGVHGVAVPVFGADGAVLASLAVIVPTMRAGDLEQKVESLWLAAGRIERELAGNDQ